jgi:hypothetical protein
MKFYLSCRKPMPEPEIMDAEVGVAMEDWEGVPTHELPEVCAEARRRAGGFPPSNSTVIEAWQEVKDKRRRQERDQDLYERPRTPPTPPKTAEELAELNRFFDGLRASMGLA